MSLKNTLGIAVGKATYRDWRRLFASDRWQGLAEKGARLQRLLFASTGTKDPEASDTLYIEAFAAPDTIDTMPDKTLKAFADHGKVGDPLPEDGGDADQVFKAHRDAGHRYRRARAEAPEGGRGGLRQVLDGAARHDQVRIRAPRCVDALDRLDSAAWLGCGE